MFVLFKVTFPDRIDEKLYDTIKKCLPAAPAQSKEATDMNVTLEEFKEEHKNKHSHPDDHDEEEDDDEHPGAQRVQCNQQ